MKFGRQYKDKKQWVSFASDLNPEIAFC